MPDVRPSSELIIDTSMFRTAGQPLAASSGNASRQTLTISVVEADDHRLRRKLMLGGAGRCVTVAVAPSSRRWLRR